MPQQLSSLPVGAKVKELNTKYYGKPIIFQVIDKNHPGYPANSVTLLTEKIITLKAFDAKEPSNPNTDRQSYGNNRYAHSNIRQWLNKDTSPWYAAQHEYDTPPNNSNVNSGWNDYEAEAGFLANFSAELKSKLLLTTLTVAKNTVTDGGGSETVQDKVFLLSETEVGLGNENGIAEGTAFSIFNSNSARQAYPTAEAVSNSEYTNGSLNASSAWYWWLRTPYAGGARSARGVGSSGSLSDNNAYSGFNGVRPALNLPSDILVSDSTDADGAYVVVWNQPPIINVTNKTFPTISFSASDSDGAVQSVSVKLNGVTKQTYNSGFDAMTYTINLSDLNIGNNSLVIEAIDNNGSITTKTLTVTKTGMTTPLLANDVRLTVPNSNEVAVFIERDAGLTVEAKANGQTMTKTTVGNEDQFTAVFDDVQPIEVCLTITRSSVNDAVKINKILGGVG